MNAASASGAEDCGLYCDSYSYDAFFKQGLGIGAALTAAYAVRPLWDQRRGGSNASVGPAALRRGGSASRTSTSAVGSIPEAAAVREPEPESGDELDLEQDCSDCESEYDLHLGSTCAAAAGGSVTSVSNDGEDDDAKSVLSLGSLIAVATGMSTQTHSYSLTHLLSITTTANSPFASSRAAATAAATAAAAAFMPGACQAASVAVAAIASAVSDPYTGSGVPALAVIQARPYMRAATAAAAAAVSRCNNTITIFLPAFRHASRNFFSFRKQGGCCRGFCCCCSCVPRMYAFVVLLL